MCFIKLLNSRFFFDDSSSYSYIVIYIWSKLQYKFKFSKRSIVDISILVHRQRRCNLKKQSFSNNNYLYLNSVWNWKLFIFWNKHPFIIYCIPIFWLLQYFGPIFIQLIIGTVILIFQLSIDNLLVFSLLTFVCCRINYGTRNIEYIIYCQHFRNGFFIVSNILNGYYKYLFRTSISKLHYTNCSCNGIYMRLQLVLCLQLKLDIIWCT